MKVTVKKEIRLIIFCLPIQLSELFDTSAQNIGLHIKNILQDNELEENSVVKDFFITASDGKNSASTLIGRQRGVPMLGV